MDLPLILIIIGAIIVIISFFIGNTSKRTEKDLEQLTLTFYNENNQLKQRIKVIEEELLLPSKTSAIKQTPKKAPAVNVSSLNKILVSQVLVLHDQGYSVSEIAKRSSLSYDEITSILQQEVTS